MWNSHELQTAVHLISDNMSGVFIALLIKSSNSAANHFRSIFVWIQIPISLVLKWMTQLGFYELISFYWNEKAFDMDFKTWFWLISEKNLEK